MQSRYLTYEELKLVLTVLIYLVQFTRRYLTYEELKQEMFRMAKTIEKRSLSYL